MRSTSKHSHIFTLTHSLVHLLNDDWMEIKIRFSTNIPRFPFICNDHWPTLQYCHNNVKSVFIWMFIYVTCLHHVHPSILNSRSCLHNRIFCTHTHTHYWIYCNRLHAVMSQLSITMAQNMQPVHVNEFDLVQWIFCIVNDIDS